jgi:hypothetical protein
MGPRVLTYHGDVTHLMGESFTCPRFMLNGGVRKVRWVVTDVVYQSKSDVTYVELDVSTEEAA